MQNPDLFSYQQNFNPRASGGVPSEPSSDRESFAVGDVCGQSERAAKYPHHAGYKEHTTSKDAANKIEASGRADVLRQRVLFALRRPMTPKQVAIALEEEITSVRPRITELKQRKLIEETGERSQGQHIYVAV